VARSNAAKHEIDRFCADFQLGLLSHNSANVENQVLKYDIA
jgi:hypothetical protein